MIHLANPGPYISPELTENPYLFWLYVSVALLAVGTIGGMVVNARHRRVSIALGCLVVIAFISMVTVLILGSQHSQDGVNQEKTAVAVYKQAVRDWVADDYGFEFTDEAFRNLNAGKPVTAYSKNGSALIYLALDADDAPQLRSAEGSILEPTR